MLSKVLSITISTMSTCQRQTLLTKGLVQTPVKSLWVPSTGVSGRWNRTLCRKF